MMHSEILNHMEYLFSLALKTCKDVNDAEDLTQETLLAAIQYRNRGGEFSNLKYWLASTLSHKWNDMLRKKYKLPTVSIDMVPEIADESYEEPTEDRPSAEQVRREVAYLAKLQREVVVKHYLRGQKVQAIADELGVPKGTVLSRLSSGREQMRKGLETMEQYEKQSYIPERLDIICHGRPGFHDEPWSLVAGDLMKQNILIIAYEKPVTPVEIAKALGIPTPYVEHAVNDLVKSELMCRTGNRVFTDFMMVTPEQLLRGLDAELKLADEYYDMIWACMNALFTDLRALAWYDDLDDRGQVILEYYAMLDLFSRGIYTATRRIVDAKEEYPERPDGGAWIARGNRYPADFDFGNYRVAKYFYGGERRAYWERFLNSKSIDLHVYDTQPELNRYEHGPVEIHDDNLCKLLYIIDQGISFDSIGFNLMFLEDIPHLVECGVLRYEDDRPKVAIPVVSKAQFEELFRVILAHMTRFADLLETPLRELFPKCKIDVPKHLAPRIAEFRQYSCYSLPMAVIKKAVEKGEFLKGVDYPTPPMVLAVEK